LRLLIVEGAVRMLSASAVRWTDIAGLPFGVLIVEVLTSSSREAAA